MLKMKAKTINFLTALSLALLMVPGSCSPSALAEDKQPEKVNLVDGNPPYLVWKADSEPKAVVLCMHELGFYSGVFQDVGSRMSQNGMTVYSMDLRGFGGWSGKGKDGKMDLDKTLADAKAAAEALHKLYPKTPVFVLGEAMGGTMALKVASTYPDLIQGVISSCPDGDHYRSGHNYLSVCGHFFTGPNKKYGMGKELVAAATPKTDLQSSYQSDPNIRLNLSPVELMTCQFFMYKARRMARDIKDTPVLIVQGQKDGESRPEGAEKVYDNLATKQKKLLKIADGDHYVFEDRRVGDQAMGETIAWIDEQLKSH